MRTSGTFLLSTCDKPTWKSAIRSVWHPNALGNASERLSSNHAYRPEVGKRSKGLLPHLEETLERSLIEEASQPISLPVMPVINPHFG